MERSEETGAHAVETIDCGAPASGSRVATPLTAAERGRLRSQISMSLVNVQVLHAFWSPTTRRFYSRQASMSPDQVRGSGRGRSSLPPDAAFIGTYEWPVTAAAVLEDLDDLIPTLQPPAAAPVQTSAQREPSSVAAPREIPPTRWSWARTHFNFRGDAVMKATSRLKSLFRSVADNLHGHVESGRVPFPARDLSELQRCLVEEAEALRARVAELEDRKVA